MNILEIGFGEGKALLEISAISKKIFCYGLNDIRKDSLSNVKDLLRNSRYFGLKPLNTPKIYFYDAGKGLKFKSDHFDLIYSQVAIHYVGDKAKLIEETWRILKKGGYAYLHIDNTLQGKQPDFMHLCKDTPRFVIYNNGKIISTAEYFEKFRKKGFDIKITFRDDLRKNITIVLHKNSDKRLNLDLLYDGNSTIYLSKLRDIDEFKFDTAIWWGTRSVFKRV